MQKASMKLSAYAKVLLTFLLIMIDNDNVDDNNDYYDDGNDNHKLLCGWAQPKVLTNKVVK